MAKQRVTLEVLSYHATAPAEEALKLKVRVESRVCYGLSAVIATPANNEPFGEKAGPGSNPRAPPIAISPAVSLATASVTYSLFCSRASAHRDFAGDFPPWRSFPNVSHLPLASYFDNFLLRERGAFHVYVELTGDWRADK